VRLLFDQNVSPWLCGSLAHLFPDTVHVRDIGLKDADDNLIWEYAARNGFSIVTKDADFRQKSFLLGHPPKVIWLGIGNCSTKAIEALLRSRASVIAEFHADEEKSFLGLW
jgi:predicted nuclease of predicted toxin-antitoxin system